MRICVHPGADVVACACVARCDIETMGSDCGGMNAHGASEQPSVWLVYGACLCHEVISFNVQYICLRECFAGCS